MLFEVGHAARRPGLRSATAPRGRSSSPRRSLVTDRLQLIHHFAGPDLAAPRRQLDLGQLVKPATVDPKSIPWLLLSAKIETAGKFGNRLTQTTFIQRINTRGGIAPAASTCTAATAGAKKEVPYTADYYFWRKAV